MESREENLKNNKVFEVLQRVGRSFMLPIAILPVAGLFLGIGSSFTNETMLKAYGLYGIMGPGNDNSRHFNGYECRRKYRF